MSAVLAWFTYANFLVIYPWLLNATSLTCAYCLSNSKVVLGRYIGVVAATGWSVYGILINELSFFFANIIFAWIYGSAIYKFNSKRDEYKATFEEQKAEIERLQKELEKKRIKEEKILDAKRDQIKRIAARAEKNLEEIRELANAA